MREELLLRYISPDQLAGLHVQTHDLPGSDHRMLVTDIGVNASVRKD